MKPVPVASSNPRGHFPLMPFAPNPAFEAFLASFNDEVLWAEVFIRRADGSFQLCHAADRAIAPDQLERVPASEARGLSAFSEAGEFRPLKTAPNLRRGWLMICSGAEDLWRALQGFYPGSIADWHAARAGAPPVTQYREYVSRQSGMYRVTQLLSDKRVGEVIVRTCAPQSCLKRRLWSVDETPIDSFGGKSRIPCLEPCALLLESARKAARAAREEERSADEAGEK